MSNSAYKDWEVYERMIARMIADQASTHLCVTPNAQIRGNISRIDRQIDVLVDVRHDTDNSRRLIVDAKRRKRKIDVQDVESFLGLMQDVNATHGYLVSASGHTPAAEERAQRSVSMRIVPVDRLENFDPTTRPPCQSPRCKNGRIFWDGYPELSLTGVPTGGADRSPKKLSFVHYVGKCDRCGMFHVWCTTCDDLLLVPHVDEDDIGHQCSCKLPWFWLASIEEDDKGEKSAELHGIYFGITHTVSRRGL
jgi:hypothetical protein